VTQAGDEGKAVELVAFGARIPARAQTTTPWQIAAMG